MELIFTAVVTALKFLFYMAIFLVSGPVFITLHVGRWSIWAMVLFPTLMMNAMALFPTKPFKSAILLIFFGGVFGYLLTFLWTLAQGIPYLANMQCGPTMSTLTGYLHGLPNIGFTCAAGLNRVSFGIYSIGNRVSVTLAQWFVAGSFNEVFGVRAWCDGAKGVVMKSMFGQEACHLVVWNAVPEHGLMAKLDAPAAWVPGWEGMALGAGVLVAMVWLRQI
jgi:hypothetical protein